MIVIVSCTNRPESNTRKVTATVEGIYRALDVSFRVLDLAELPPNIILPSAYQFKPPAFQQFIDAVIGADGVVFVTPEYNGGIPGILKYFIDMLPFPESFENRPVCFVGLAAGIWGALRPVEQLQAILGYRNAYIFPERVFMPGVNKLLHESGELKEPDIKARLEKQAKGFIRFVENLQLKKPDHSLKSTALTR
jgi:chromate reductase, NAD(P)H dehydrogenase (quinone)